MALVREAIEDCAPPGSLVRAEYLTPEFTIQAEALVHAIYLSPEGVAAPCAGGDLPIAQRPPQPTQQFPLAGPVEERVSSLGATAQFYKVCI